MRPESERSGEAPAETEKAFPLALPDLEPPESSSMPGLWGERHIPILRPGIPPATEAYPIAGSHPEMLIKGRQGFGGAFSRKGY